MENIRLISALCTKYLNVYEIDVASSTARVIKLEGYVTNGINAVANSFDYETMLKRYSESRIPKEDYNLFNESLSIKSIKEKLKNNDTFDFTYRVIDNDHKIHFYTATYSISSSKDEPLKVVCGFRIIDNIIEQQKEKFNEGINKAYKALSSIYASMFRIDVINDTFTVIATCNDVKEAISKTSLKFSEALPIVINETCSTPFKNALASFLDLSTIDKRLKNTNHISYEFISTNHGWCKGIIIKEDVVNNKITNLLFAIEIIEISKQREQALKASAETDLLTGIYNRGYGQKCIEEKISNLKSGFFAILDCDHFKNINDEYGHQMGDRVIIEIAKALEKSAKDSDIVFRLGGDEFAIFSSIIKNNDEVDVLFDSIVKNIRAIKIENIKNTFSISLGGTFIRDKKDTFSILYKRADDAMYESKSVEGFKATIK